MSEQVAKTVQRLIKSGDAAAAEMINALHAEVEALRVHFNAMQLQRNHHRDAAANLRTELEALLAENGRLDPAGSMAKCMDAMRDRDEHAKAIDRLRLELEAALGLLDVARSKLETLKGDPVGVGELLGDIDALLTTTPAPEVPDHIAEASKMVTPEAQQDEDAWQTLHAISKAPQDGEKLTAERLHAICEIGHDRKAFIARLAEQVDRQEAVVYAVHAKGMQVDHHCPLVSPDMAADYLEGCATALYTTPQPSPDVRGLVEAVNGVKLTPSDMRHWGRGSVWWNNAVEACLDAIKNAHRQAQQSASK